MIKAARQSVNENDCGLNPLEYAINSSASMNVIRTLQRASVVAWNEMDRHRANQEILKKKLQAAVRQTEKASRHRLTSTASTMLINNCYCVKNSNVDRRENCSENAFLSEASAEKKLMRSQETLKSSASKAAL